MQERLLTTVRLEDFVPADDSLRPVRRLVHQALKRLDDLFRIIYADSSSQTSIASETLPRALLLLVFYSVCSERMLM